MNIANLIQTKHNGHEFSVLFGLCSDLRCLNSEILSDKDVGAWLLSTQMQPVLIFSLFPFYHQNCPVGWYENKQEEKGEVRVDSSLWVGLSFLQHRTTFI